MYVLHWLCSIHNCSYQWFIYTHAVITASLQPASLGHGLEAPYSSVMKPGVVVECIKMGSNMSTYLSILQSQKFIPRHVFCCIQTWCFYMVEISGTWQISVFLTVCSWYMELIWDSVTSLALSSKIITMQLLCTMQLLQHCIHRWLIADVFEENQITLVVQIYDHTAWRTVSLTGD